MLKVVFCRYTESVGFSSSATRNVVRSRPPFDSRGVARRYLDPRKYHAFIDD